MLNQLYHNLQAGNYEFVIEQIMHDPEAINATFKNSIRLIHFASQLGYLEVVKAILEKDINQINKADSYGQTPILYACAHGQLEIVEYFVSLDFVINNLPKAIKLANQGMYYPIANLLIHSMLDDNNRNDIFNFLQSPVDAYEYMLLDARNRELILNNPKHKAMLRNLNVDNQNISFFKPQGRRPSFYIEIDSDNNFKHFLKGIQLGDGESCNGQVFDFVSADNEHRAVKYDIDIWDDSPETVQHARMERENRQLVYPGINNFFVFKRKACVNAGVAKEYSFRDVSEFIDGETLKEYFPKVNCLAELANLTLLIVAELERIHLHVIHGDVKEDNIMVYQKDNQTQVKFIDFGGSSKITDQYAQTFHIPEGCRHLAPEVWSRTGEPNIAPHSSQDVYSLAYMLNALLELHNLFDDFYTEFPSVSEFIKNGLTKSPASSRPSLQSFYSALSIENSAYLASRQVVSLESVSEIGLRA